jgi:hypothetical protein
MNKIAKAGMSDFKRESKFAASAIGMGHHQGTRREQRGQRQPQAPNLHKVTRAAELQGPAIDKHPQRHADAEPNI